MSTGADLSKFLKGAAAARAKALQSAARAVDVFGEHVIGDSQQLTPVATGFLQASGTTEPAEENGDRVSKVIGHNAAYAAAVHERLQAKHKVGQAKFLSTAIENNGPKFGPFVAGRVRAAMEGGGG